MVLALGLSGSCSHAIDLAAVSPWAGRSISKITYVDVGGRPPFLIKWVSSHEGHDLAADHTGKVI